MQMCPGNTFGLATPLQSRPALRALYYLDTEVDFCMKTKIIPYSAIIGLGENIGEFGELTVICQCFAYQYFTNL